MNEADTNRDRERERDRDRENQPETDRRTDRQTDRQTDMCPGLEWRMSLAGVAYRFFEKFDCK